MGLTALLTGVMVTLVATLPSCSVTRTSTAVFVSGTIEPVAANTPSLIMRATPSGCFGSLKLFAKPELSIRSAPHLGGFRLVAVIFWLSRVVKSSLLY